MSGWSPILEFDLQGEEFALGFEMGRLWEMAKADDDEFTQGVHAANIEMVLRIAEAAGRAVTSEDRNDEWIDVTFAERAVSET